MIIHIIGNPRSGTTMMRHILGKHPSIYRAREFHFFDSLTKPGHLHQRLSLANVTELASRLICIERDGFLRQKDHKQFHREAIGVIQEIPEEHRSAIQVYITFMRHNAQEHGKHIACDQSPQYAYYLENILESLPDVKVIVMVRDPRDIMTSRKRKWRFRFLREKHVSLRETLRAWSNYHPFFSPFFWKSAIQQASAFLDHDNVCFVRFEDVLQDAEREIQRVCAFLGLDYQKAMLDIPTGKSSILADNPEKRGVDAGRHGTWRQGGLNSTEIFLTQVITGRLMRQFGYDPVRVFPNPLRLLWYLLSLPFKASLTFLLHLRYHADIKENLKRRFWPLSRKFMRNV